MSRDALVVGINVYQKLPTLNAPAQDAEAIAKNLEGFGEFRVCRLPEVIQSDQPVVGRQGGVTAAVLEDALIKLFKPPGKNVPQTAIFYYSGHGLQREAGVREGYLATSDVNPSSGNYGLSLFWLRRLLQESPVRQRIIWLDCCHSGELLNFLEADPGAREGTDRLFMAASREYEPAYEALDGQHSVFTKALLMGLNPYRAKGGIVNSYHLTEVVSSSLKGEIQQPLFESSGSDIVLTRVAGIAAVVSSEATTALDRLKQMSYRFCPYRGLQPFEATHASYFFGREQLTAQLITYVKNSPFCAVVGASGIGKSSLLNAGLIHSLSQGQSAPGIRWQVRRIVPDQNPLQRLAEAFIDPDAEGLERADQLRRAETFLQDGGPGLAQLVRATFNTNGHTHLQSQHLVLVIDQFEQALPRFDPAAPEADTDELSGVRSQFFRCLSEVLSDGSLPLHIVIGLRADQIEHLRPYPNFYALVTEHCLTVLPMAYEQVKAAVLKPLEKMGLNYDANLIYTLMLDVVGAPGELALLQLALQELWRRREKDPSGQTAPRLTLAAYAGLGGVRNLLNQRATEVFQSLSATEQTAAKRIFLSLCELGEGTEDSRRHACLSELFTPALPAALVAQTLEKLVDAHLVVVNHDTMPQGKRGVSLPGSAWTSSLGLKQDHSRAIVRLLSQVPTDTISPAGPVSTLDIVHESLIRTWPLLRQWLAADRQVIWLQRRLEAAAVDWQQQGYPTHPEYLLTGKRLRDAEEFQKNQGHWLSSVAQSYLATSQREDRNRRWRRQAMQLLIPASLLMGMLASYSQFKVSQYAADLAAPKPEEISRPKLTSPPARRSPTTGAGGLALVRRLRGGAIAPITLSPLIPAGQPIAPSPLLAAAQKQTALAQPLAQFAGNKAGGVTFTPPPPGQVATGRIQGQPTTTSANTPSATIAPQPVIVVWCIPATPTPLCSTAISQ